MEKKWWQKSVVYQIYPRSFQDSNGDGIGDLKGITKRLPYVKELGADVIWLSPVYQSPNDDNGYDISDYQAIMTEFGTMEDFDEMLDCAHSLGLKIVMDLVVNHTSDEHAWFRSARSGKDSPYRDFYIWRDPKNGGEPNNWGSCFGGSAWEYDEASGQYFLHLFSKKQPDLNWDNPAVRDAVFDMMDWWLRKGIDGFRMDVISLISKPTGLPDGDAGSGPYAPFSVSANGPHIHDYLQEMNRRVLSRYDIMTVGETPGLTIEEAGRFSNLDGRELSMCFQFEHTSLDEDPVRGRYGFGSLVLTDLKENLSKWQYGLEGRAWNSLYWDNHDQPRIVSRWGNDSAEWREKSAKMLATCLHMMKGTPYVYQGEELGMTNYPWENLGQINDIESLGNVRSLMERGLLTEEEAVEVMRRQSRDNARTPMQWDASENAGFTEGTPWLPVNPAFREINAAEQTGREDSVFNYYRKLIALRKQYDIIAYGRYELLEAEDPDLFIYTRELGGEKLLVVCNFTEKERVWQIPEEFADGEILITNDERTSAADAVIRPYESIVIYMITAPKV
ncbi:MAG: alpha,alpha-phosphotrehalase [Lachnospiraceae bacterium]|nr:alpha,alpha-phosphotrehalase [Lachnospiraceae bacterium]